MLSTLDIVGGALTYNESFGGTPNQMSIASTGVLSEGGFYTITEQSQPITLSRNAIALGWSGDGTTVVTGPVASVSSISITAANQASTLFVESIDAPASVTGFQAVNAGEALGGSPVTLQGIRQALSVTNAGGQTSLTLDDSTDATSQSWTLGAGKVSGASPAPINFTPGTTSQLTIDGGTGGNPVFISDTSVPTVVNSGTGADVINVTGVTAALTLNPQGVTSQIGGLADSVIVTNGPAVTGPITIQGQGQQTMLTVDDTASRADRTSRLGVGVLSGLTAQPILFTPGVLNGLILQGGAGADALTVDFTEGNPIPSVAGVNYNGGAGNNSLSLVGGSFQNENMFTGGPGAGIINLDGSLIQFSNLAPITDTVTAQTYNFNTGTQTNTTVNIVNGPAVGGLPTTEINSGETPPAFELVDLANKTTIILNMQSDGGFGPGSHLVVNNPNGGAGLANLVVNGDTTDDLITVAATPAGVATVVTTGGGNDVVDVAAAGLGAGSTFTAIAGDGSSTLNVNAGGGLVTFTAATVSVAGHPTINLANFTQVNIVQAGDPPLTPIPVTVGGTEGVPFANVVAGAFSDADPNGLASNFTASIDWGDGTPSTAGTITRPGGPPSPFNVQGSHTYSGSGLFTVRVKVTDLGNTFTTNLGGVPFTVTDPGGSTTTIASSFDVAVSPITARGLPIPPVVEGFPLTAAVAAFRLNNTSTTDVFTAGIDWGDGTSPSAGTVTRQPDGSFLVTGTHTYARESAPGKPYPVTVTIVDPRGGQTTVTTSATVLEDLVVRTAADSGPHSLRDVILDVDADGLGGTITFDIPGPGPYRIMLLSPLPTVAVPVVIDGTSQPGFHGRPVIVLNGAHAGAEADGLTLAGGNSTVKGLVINGFGGTGVVLQGRGGDRVLGNEIGTDLSGTSAVGNGDGVDVDNVGGNIIGGTTPAERNIISGNQDVGIRVSANGAAGNRVQGNFIGTDVTGNAAVPNYQGVLINGAPHNLIGGSTPGAGNLISGNASAGVQIFNDATVFNGRPQFTPPGVATGNVLQGNLIGTNAAGIGKLGNAQGVFINDAAANLIGGTTPAVGNVISGNRSIGVQILGDNATRNALLGNAIGTDRTHTRRLGNSTGVYVYASPGNVVDLSSSPRGNFIAFNASGNLKVRPLSQGPAVEQALAIPPVSGSLTGFLLTFTTYLNAQRASNPGSYLVTTVNRDGTIGTRIPIASAIYNDIYRTVVLQFASPVPRTTTLRLTVIGTSPSGLTDQAGNFLNGDASIARRSSGSNFQATFVRGVRSRA